MKSQEVAKLVLQALEDSDKLAASLSSTLLRIIKKNPDAELVFSIMWALHRYKARKTKSRTSTITVAKMKAAGRRIGRPAITVKDERVKRVKALLKAGKSCSTICDMLGISKSTVYRLADIR